MKWAGTILLSAALGAGIIIALHHTAIGKKIMGF
jgi:hypothetical protein